MKSGNERVAIIDRYAAIVRTCGSSSEKARLFRTQYHHDLNLLGRFRQLNALIDSEGYQKTLAQNLPTKRKR